MLDWLLGNSSSADKALDAVVNTADALFYTDQEKAIASQKILDFKIKYAAATQAMSISRRVIAITVSAMWAITGLTILVAKALGSVAFTKFAMVFMADIVNPPFMIIIGFYFLAHLVKK